MKKLKLNLQQFQGAEILTRSQLKKVLGGEGGSDVPCNEDSDCADLGPNCFCFKKRGHCGCTSS